MTVQMVLVLEQVFHWVLVHELKVVYPGNQKYNLFYIFSIMKSFIKLSPKSKQLFSKIYSIGWKAVLVIIVIYILYKVYLSLAEEQNIRFFQAEGEDFEAMRAGKFTPDKQWWYGLTDIA